MSKSATAGTCPDGRLFTPSTPGRPLGGGCHAGTALAASGGSRRASCHHPTSRQIARQPVDESVVRGERPAMACLRRGRHDLYITGWLTIRVKPTAGRAIAQQLCRVVPGFVLLNSSVTHM